MSKKKEQQEIANRIQAGIQAGVGQVSDTTKVDVTITSGDATTTAKADDAKKPEAVKEPKKAKTLTQEEIEIEREKQRAKLTTEICEQSDAWQDAHCAWSSSAEQAKELKKDAESEQNKLNRLNRKLAEVMSPDWRPAATEPPRTDPQKKLFTPPEDPAEKLLVNVLRGYDTPEGKLTAAKIDKICDAVGGDTIKHLEDFMRSNIHWNTSMKGVGEKYLTILQDAHLAFRVSHPIPTSEDQPKPKAAADKSGITRETEELAASTAESAPAEDRTAYASGFEQGAKAWHQAAKKGDNPYDAGTPEKHGWRDGWDAADNGDVEPKTILEHAEAAAS